MYVVFRRIPLFWHFKGIMGSGEFWRWPLLKVGGSLCTGETRGLFSAGQLINNNTGNK